MDSMYAGESLQLDLAALFEAQVARAVDHLDLNQAPLGMKKRRRLKRLLTRTRLRRNHSCANQNWNSARLN